MAEVPQLTFEAVPTQELPKDLALNQVDPQVFDLVPREQLAQRLEDIQFQYCYPICGYISSDSRREIEICSNPAGYQTKHEGQSRCYKHENASFKPRSPYTQYLRQYRTLQEVFEVFQNREKKLNDLSEEINVARAVLAMQLKEFQEGKKAANQEVFQNVLYALELIRKIADSMAKISLTEASGITLDSISAFLWQVSDILTQELIDPEKRLRILDRIATETAFS